MLDLSVLNTVKLLNRNFAWLFIQVYSVFTINHESINYHEEMDINLFKKNILLYNNFWESNKNPNLDMSEQTVALRSVFQNYLNSDTPFGGKLYQS